MIAVCKQTDRIAIAGYTIEIKDVTKSARHLRHADDRVQNREGNDKIQNFLTVRSAQSSIQKGCCEGYAERE